MVTVFLRGGLGNQMFEYATAMNLAKKNGTGIVLDTVFIRDRFPRPHFSYRTYDLDVFNISPRFTPLSAVANNIPIPGVWLGLDLLGVGLQKIVGVRSVVIEKSDRFDPSVLAEKGDIFLAGRWQSEKYFAEVANEVRAAFRFHYPFEGEAKVLAEKIKAANSISLHVRRGDYATFKNVEQLMGATDLGYYSRAAAYVGERTESPQFFVFSDDIEWCKQNIKIPFSTTFVDDASRGPKASWHMALMAQCKHNIITNSTFSWWGAWLNANPQKIVVAPKNWYADPTHANDTVPEGWIKI